MLPPRATERLNRPMAGRSSRTETPTNNRPEGVCMAPRWARSCRVTPVPVAATQARQSRAVAGAMPKPSVSGQ